MQSVPPESGRLRCQQCQSELHPADVVVSTLEARCRHCGWTFGGKLNPYRVGGLPEPRVEEPNEDEERRIVPRPRTMQVLEGPVPTIVHRLPGDVAIGASLLVGALGLIVALITLGRGPVFEPMLLVFVLSIPPVTYLALSRLFNRRHIELNGPYLQVRQRPFPLPFATMVPRREVTQIYVRQYDIGRGHRRFAVMAQHGHDATMLLSGLDSPIEALFIEQEIERQLAIEDVPMAGEYQHLAKKRGR